MRGRENDASIKLALYKSGCARLHQT